MAIFWRCDEYGHTPCCSNPAIKGRPLFSMNETAPTIAFAHASSERDFLRGILSENGGRILYFENEAICFDNLKSLAPQAIVIRTDSSTIAWRFIFALHALQLDTRLLILSDHLTTDHFNLQGLSVTILCLPVEIQEGMLGRLIQQCAVTRDHLRPILPTELFVGENRAVKNINAKLPSLAHSSGPILITGEPGTGKELLARLIVQYAGKKTVFVKLNCETIRADSFREKILGKATSVNSSILESAIAGAAIYILIHKINRLDEAAQSEMLMLLDRTTGRMMFPEYDPEINIQLIATSEVGLFPMVERGEFRKDLYYRLNVIPLNLPPLRERKLDLPLLVDYFIISACAKTNRSFIIPPAMTINRMLAYNWPGNLKELKQETEQFATSGDEKQIFAHIGTMLQGKYNSRNVTQLFEIETLPDPIEIQSCLAGTEQLSLKSICDRFASRTEKKLMQKALETTNWNRRKAAALLNISYKSMLNKMKIYEIV
jgi:DNA-binding NtrC family response regulator